MENETFYGDGQSWILRASKWVVCPWEATEGRATDLLIAYRRRYFRKTDFTFLSAYPDKTCHCSLFLFSSAR